MNRLLAATLVLCLTGGTAPAQKKDAATTKTLALPAIERFTLDNGLEVAFMRVDSAPVVSVQVWYHAGSKDEARNKRGEARMFQNLMFKGSEHLRTDDHAREINQLGGYVSAATTEDATFFYETLPSDYLDFALELEAERMRNLLFLDDVIAVEREAVKQEIRQTQANPIAQGFLRFLEIAYTSHPYAWTAGGTLADLDQTTSKDLEAFYDTYYVPNNALVVVVGNVTLDDVKKSVDAHFGAMAKAADPPRPADAAAEPAQTEQRKATVETGQIGLSLIGYKIPEATHKDIYALQLLERIFGDGESARLRQRIKTPVGKGKDKKSLGVEAGAQMMLREDPGVFAVVGVYTDPAGEDKIEAALLDEIEKMAKKGPTADELRKAKNQIQAEFVFGLENVDGIAQQMGQSWILTRDPSQFMRDVDELEKVTIDDIKRVTKSYLSSTQATIVIVPPAKQKAPAAEKPQ